MNVRPSLRAPRDDGVILVQPPLNRIGSLLRTNRHRLASHAVDILGTSAHRLRSLARADLLRTVRDYLGTATTLSSDLPLLMSGHQPELFHPGVWVKNFALAGLARKHGGTAVNLVVDNDTAKSTALRVPAAPDAEHPWPRLLSVPFDHWNGETPYEEAAVVDERQFADFGERVSAMLRRWDYQPLLADFWTEVRRQSEATPLAGERFARARRALERRWGCANLEAPVSGLCRGPTFAHFACHLLVCLPRFHELYNATVQAYREAHGIRSRNHPVPDLVREGDWLEAPFWAWRSGQSRRGRLMARLTNDGLQLRAGTDPWPTLPWKVDDPERLTQAWQELEGQGRKVRSRALTNTLYARVFLCDLFLHGIGGGKYDELTDELIRDFYALEPPKYVVLSATRLLPLPGYSATLADCRRLARLRRDLRWNPDRHLSSDATRDGVVRDLVSEKYRRVAETPPNAAGRRERFADIREINERLRPLVGQELEATRKRCERCERELEANALLQRRDYAFCLYPEAVLRPFCTQFLD